jgi:hypothetical protein
MIESTPCRRRELSIGWSVSSAMTIKKKVIWVVAFILLMAVVIVLCVELFSTTQESQYEGTLVRQGIQLITRISAMFYDLR